MLFKKVIGEASFGQVSLIFTVIALLNTILLSPVVAAFYFSGYEVVVWSHLPWPNLLIAAALSLGEETNVPTPVEKPDFFFFVYYKMCSVLTSISHHWNLNIIHILKTPLTLKF